MLLEYFFSSFKFIIVINLYNEYICIYVDIPCSSKTLPKSSIQQKKKVTNTQLKRNIYVLNLVISIRPNDGIIERFDSISNTIHRPCYNRLERYEG